MKSKIITRDRELSAFIDIYSELSGNPLSIDYVRKCKVRGFYNKRRHFVAGYLINKGPDLRYLDFIPSNKHEPLLRKFGVFPDDMVEITSIWMNTKVINHQQRLKVYALSVWDAFRSGKQLIIGGAFSKKLTNIQMMALPTKLYEGHGSNYVDNRYCWVYFSDRRRVLVNLVKALSILTLEKLLIRHIGFVSGLLEKLPNRESPSGKASKTTPTTPHNPNEVRPVEVG